MTLKEIENKYNVGVIKRNEENIYWLFHLNKLSNIWTNYNLKLSEIVITNESTKIELDNNDGYLNIEISSLQDSYLLIDISSNQYDMSIKVDSNDVINVLEMIISKISKFINNQSILTIKKDIITPFFSYKINDKVKVSDLLSQFSIEMEDFISDFDKYEEYFHVK